MKIKKILIIFSLILVNIFILLFSKSYFTFRDSNEDSYIHIGQIKKKKFSSFLYGTVGPPFTYRVDIPYPGTNTYDHYKSLDSYPYNNWAIERHKEIIDMVQNNSGIIPDKYKYQYAKEGDPDYFKNNSIIFDSNVNTGFADNRGFHLFSVICNNAHKREIVDKINIIKSQLRFGATVDFKSSLTEKKWDTYFRDDIEFTNNKYYVTRAYEYNKETEKYVEITRGSWDFFNSADLVIVDLGITGYIEIADNKNSTLKLDLKQKMLFHHFGARVAKARYNVDFFPLSGGDIISSELRLGE